MKVQTTMGSMYIETNADELRTVYFAVLHYAECLIKDISNPDYVRGHKAEEYEFLGEQIHKAGRFLNEFEQSGAAEQLGVL